MAEEPTVAALANAAVEEAPITPVLASEAPAEPQNIPPFPFTRNDFGLLKHVNYTFNQDGTINWRAMVKKEHLVFNRQMTEEIEKKYGKPLSELSVTEVEDRYLLILLAGLKELSQLRGFTSVTYKFDAIAGFGVAAVCKITWIPNYETGSTEITFEAMADASSRNTTGFAKNYLMAIAENRAFVRAIRNFLRIHVVGQDEVGTTEEAATTSVSPHSVLKQLLDVRGIMFEKMQNKLIAEKYEGAESWKQLEDIPEEKVYELMGRITSKAQKNGNTNTDEGGKQSNDNPPS
jgi:hypothetical protein